MDSSRLAHQVKKGQELEEIRHRELCERYRAVFCTPMGAEVFYDITETICQFSLTTEETPEAVALKNLAALLRARIGLADESHIKLEIMNAPGIQINKPGDTSAQ